MSDFDVSVGGAKFYDPVEVDTYISEVNGTIRTLQSRLDEAVRRAEEAERAFGESVPESASLGRALLLASEVAEKTLSEADARAAQIVQAAQVEAQSLIDAARHESDRVVGSAKEAAAAYYRAGQDRILEAVAAFVEGATVLRNQLAEVEQNVPGWQSEDLFASPKNLTPPSPPAPVAFGGSTTPAKHNGNGRRQDGTGDPPPPASVGESWQDLPGPPPLLPGIGDPMPPDSA